MDGRLRSLSDTDFIPFSSPPLLSDDEIHLWIFPHAANADGIIDTERFLRRTLGLYLGAEAGHVPIQRDAFGKPHLVGAELQFNLSHSRSVLLIGLSHQQALGVDIEQGVRARPYLELARRYFTAPEAEALAALPIERLPHAFLDLWSAKEAVLKALGRGIAFGLDRVGFALDAVGGVTHLCCLHEEAGTPEQWQVVRLAHAGATGALAWRGANMQLRAFSVTSAATLAPTRAS